MDDICDLISAKRKEQGLTQAELGTMPRISGKAVSKRERGLSKPCDEHLAKLIDLLDLPVEASAMAEEKEKMQQSALPSVIRKDFIRILATGMMLAVCVCNLAETISTDSTVGSLGFSVALFCFETMLKK